MSWHADKVRSLHDDIARLQERIARESESEARASERIARASDSLSRTTSRSSLQSYQSEIQRQQRELARHQAERAKLSKDLARKQSDLAHHQKELMREQQSESEATSQLLRRLQEENMRRQQEAISMVVPTLTGADEGVLHDAFVSHASEDKDELVRPLAQALNDLGCSVWYDEFTLRIGDSLRRSIDRGLASSRFGIVVLSPKFFEKNWPQYELDGMVAKEQAGVKVILPLWHRVSKDDVLRFSPTLADRVALSTSSFTVVELANKLHEVLKDGHHKI